MHEPTSPRKRMIRVATVFLIVWFFSSILQYALMVPQLGANGVVVDFDAFYIVGQMFYEGRVAAAYDTAVMAQVQHALVGHDGFMPWTYPPQFDLVALIFPLVPRGLAYGLFTASTLGVYLLLLSRLAGPRVFWVLLALAPPIYVTATIGQNAFLTGALMGWFCLASLQGRTAAGWPLGLLVIKPHLGIGLGVHALISTRWRVLAVAVAVVVLSSALATLVLGVDIWAAFLSGVAAAGDNLRSGIYPLFRMTSIYAALFSLGVSDTVALWAQMAVGLAACAVIGVAVRRGVRPQYTLAMACFTSALVSPYLYDYDMVVTGIGLALLAADIADRSSTLEKVVLLGLIWVAGGWGMIHALASAGLDWEVRAANGRATLSYGAFAYFLVLLLLWRILARQKSD